jgi:DDHD domain
VDSLNAGSKNSAAELRYLPQAAQDELLALGVFDKRLDFVLQLSSAIEEVSTSWSALRAHTDYWSNRDMMLIMISSMIKSSQGIPDNTSKAPSIETSRRVIDSHVHLKDTRIGWSAKPDLSINEMNAARAAETLTIEGAVRNFVEKLIDEAASMHELVQQHPSMRMRRGGITRSTSALSQRHSTMSQTDRSETKPSGWSTYLRWFNGSSNGESSRSIPLERSSGDDLSVGLEKNRK